MHTDVVRQLWGLFLVDISFDDGRAMYAFVVEVQPLKSLKLTESGIPEWAEDFIAKVDPDYIIDLIEAGTVLRIKMYVI